MAMGQPMQQQPMQQQAMPAP